MQRRGLANRHLHPYNVEELTSRKDATDIPDILDRLELPFRPDKRSRRGRGQAPRLTCCSPPT